MCKTIFEYNSEEKNDGRLLKYEEIVINQNNRYYEWSPFETYSD